LEHRSRQPPAVNPSSSSSSSSSSIHAIPTSFVACQLPRSIQEGGARSQLVGKWDRGGTQPKCQLRTGRREPRRLLPLLLGTRHPLAGCGCGFALFRGRVAPCRRLGAPLPFAGRPSTTFFDLHLRHGCGWNGHERILSPRQKFVAGHVKFEGGIQQELSRGYEQSSLYPRSFFWPPWWGGSSRQRLYRRRVIALGEGASWKGEVR
jgi:hypothetical protein